jgi:hypothetical protein
MNTEQLLTFFLGPSRCVFDHCQAFLFVLSSISLALFFVRVTIILFWYWFDNFTCDLVLYGSTYLWTVLSSHLTFSYYFKLAFLASALLQALGFSVRPPEYRPLLILCTSKEEEKRNVQMSTWEDLT